MLRRVVSRYVTVVRRYGRFPFRVALGGVLLFGPGYLALYLALLLGTGSALGGGPSPPTAATWLVLAGALYAVEYVLIARLARRIERREP